MTSPITLQLASTLKNTETDNTNPNIITLERIRSSQNLQELGALPGDKVENGKLIRVFSSKDDRIDLGEKLTEERINKSINLQNLQAKPGDRIVNKKLIRTETDSAYKQFVYGYDESDSDIDYASDYLERHFPVGRFGFGFDEGFIYYSPEELYGKGFIEADENTRRQMILRAKERGLLEAYGPYFEPDTDSYARLAGNVGGAVTSPTTLIPITNSLKAMTGMSALLGGSYSIIEDMAREGEIDAEKALMYSGFAGLAGAGFHTIGRGIGKIRDKNAEKIVKDAELIVAKDMEKGFSINEALEILPSKIDNEKVIKSLQRLNRPLKIPPTQSKAAEIVQDSIANDSAVTRTKSGIVEHLLGTISTRIRNISEAVGGKLRHFEFKLHVNTANTLKRASGFINDLRNLSPDLKVPITRHLYNGNLTEARKLMPENMQTNFNEVEKILNEVYTDSKKAGIFFQQLDDYFPRQVKDLDGLHTSLGIKGKTRLNQMEDDYAKKLGLDSRRDLSLTERAYIANQYVRGYGLTTDKVPRFAKKRKIEELTDEQIAKFYEDPSDSLALYLRNAINNIEKYKFFGRNAVKNKDGIFNINESIGKVIETEKAAGKLNPFDEDELVDLLQSRFISGDKPMRKGFGMFRDVGYMGTIGNPYASVTQLGDLGNAGALHGFRNTIAAMFGTKNIKLVDVGIENMSQEFAEGNIRATAKVLNKIFDWTGFRRFDQFGKETVMNAAFKKAINMVKSSKGEAAFRKEWSDLYSFNPKLLDDIVKDLKKGKVTDNVKFHAFNELSDVQPITLSEMPKGYLDNPNGRLFYMLKSFTIKQLDVARRKIFQEWRKGNKLEAVKNATALAGYLSTLNLGTKVVKDLLKGRDIDPDQLPTQAVWQLAGVYGFNKYNADQLASDGRIDRFFMNLVTPASNIPVALFGAAVESGKLLSGTVREPEYEKFMKDMPIIGPILYNWFGGGAEKYNRRLFREGFR